jgi:hypothetical protein
MRSRFFKLATPWMALPSLASSKESGKEKIYSFPFNLSTQFIIARNW